MPNEEHFIYEIKRELDWAAEEVKRTEVEVRRLEVDFTKEMEGADEEDVKRLKAEKEHLQSRVGLHEAYGLQRRAASRFLMLSQVYDIASANQSAEEIREELGNFMYRSIDESADQKDKLLELAEALKLYFSDGHSDEADEAVREAWQNIEETLRSLGRKI